MWSVSSISRASFASLSSSTNMANKVFMDVAIINSPAREQMSVAKNKIINWKGNDNRAGNRVQSQRIIFELFIKKCPVACENFIKLCTGENALPLQPSKDAIAQPSFRDQFLPQLTYRHSTFHRIVPGVLIQGGDVVGNNGTGQLSVFGETFDAPEETALSAFSKRGLLATAVSAPHLNHAQFFILTAKEAPHLNRSCICFGQVHSGWEVIEAIENVPLSGSGRPLHTVVITDCGIVESHFQV